MLALHLPPGAGGSELGGLHAAGTGLGARAPPLDSPRWPLADRPHKLQEWFGLGACLTLAPDSHSGRVLAAAEEATLLSVGAAALRALRVPWPLLVPARDARRDAAAGVAAGAAGAPAVLESDAAHGGAPARALARPAAQLELFAERLRQRAPVAAGVAAAAAAALADADADADADVGGWAAPRRPAGSSASLADDAADAEAAARLRLRFSSRRCFALPDPQDAAAGGADSGAAGANNGGFREEELELVLNTWDEGAPWRPWAAEDDPLECLELDVAHSADLSAAGGAAAALAAASGAGEGEEGGEGVSAVPAGATWRLAALRVGYVRDDGRRPLLALRAAEQRRAFLRLQSVAPAAAGGAAAAALAAALRAPGPAAPGAASFAAALRRAAEGLAFAGRARSVGELASARWWHAQGAPAPPEPRADALQDALRDIFRAPALPPGAAIGGGETWPGDDGSAGTSRPFCGKAAPLGALATRLALHALRLGSPRAAAALWARVVRELRLAHWEPGVRLPRMPRGGETSGGESSGLDPAALPPPPDPRACLLHQNLQLLDLCIAARAAAAPAFPRALALNAAAAPWTEDMRAEHAAGGAAPPFGAALAGERALHFLETLPPAALLAELLALGAAAAAALLAAAPAARLPAVAAELAALEGALNSQLADGVAAWSDDAGSEEEEGGGAGGGSEEEVEVAAKGGGAEAQPSSAATSYYSSAEEEEAGAGRATERAGREAPPPALRALLGRGLPPRRLPPLFAALGCVEATVAAGASLLRRLTPFDDGGADAAPSVAAAAAADALVAAALGAPPPGGYGAVAPLAAGGRALGRRLMAAGGGWAAGPFREEFAAEIFEVDADAVEAEEAAGAAPLHRFFLRALPAEMRVATLVTTEL